MRNGVFGSWLAALGIVLLALAAYVPAMQGGFIWDDDDYVQENAQLRTGEGLAQIWFEPGATKQYYPLVFTTFWVEYQLWGLSPFGYHLVNVLLHAAAAILLWRCLRRLAVPGAWVAAAIFALHPVHVESVAWITERKNVLSGLFYLAAFLSYLRFLQIGEEAPTARRPWKPYALAAALFACALLSKTVTATLPAAILLVVWWKRGRLRWADALPLAPLLVLGALLASQTASLEATHVGTMYLNLDLSLADRVLIAGRALWFYAAKLFWPSPLVFSYPRWSVDPAVWWQWLYPAAFVLVVLALWRARLRIGRGPLTAVLFFAGTLTPALGFIDVYPMVYSFVADHFQYLASIGLIVLAVAAGSRWLAKPAAPMVAAVVLVAFGGLTWQQGRAYADLETLWQDTLAKNPDSVMARINLANLWKNAGRLRESTDMLEQAVRTDPRVVHPRILARANFNLANNLTAANRIGPAEERYHTALELDPTYYNAYQGLGWVAERRGDYVTAEKEYRTLLQHDPAHAGARQALQQLLARKGGAPR